MLLDIKNCSPFKHKMSPERILEDWQLKKLLTKVPAIIPMKIADRCYFSPKISPPPILLTTISI